jgi:hypothetical protein
VSDGLRSSGTEVAAIYVNLREPFSKLTINYEI